MVIMIIFSYHSKKQPRKEIEIAFLFQSMIINEQHKVHNTYEYIL